MKKSAMPREIAIACLLVSIAACSGRGDPLPELVDYNFHVKPILSDRCYACHGPDAAARQAELRLDSEEGLLDSLLSSGSAPVVPGNRGKSPLYRRVSSRDIDFRMPPQESNLSLSAREIAILGRWIEQGASVKEHWSFVTPDKPALPETNHPEWPRNEIDHFVLGRLERHHMVPSAEATRATLLRRVTLDLTGLPPMLEELDAFLGDDSANAYERVVDRLLASSRYGERWAWDWLDAARYADTNGYQGDPVRTMWPWRDWVIRAINANMPYDEFTVEQLAGDLLDEPDTDQVIATGFNRNHMYNGEGGRIPEETRVENVFDRVETVGTVWMGLTLTCARCHDHKFDPLSQREYYSLFDFFNQTSETGSGFNGKVPPVLDVSDASARARLAQLEHAVAQAGSRVRDRESEIFPHGPGETPGDSPLASGLLGEHVDALRLAPSERSGYYLDLLLRDLAPEHPGYEDALTGLREANRARSAQLDQSTLVMVMDQLAERRQTYVLASGAYNQPTDAVEAAVPSFLPPLVGAGMPDRLALAKWLVSEEHPLTARVTVNRFWQAFFGNGLVKTAEDFGVQGELPSHPQLLDFLAVDFMESGWDVKALLRKIVTSATYRQSSVLPPELAERDPENRLLARGPRLRLPAWMIRDQALAMSGLLVDSLGGPPVFPYQPEGIWSEATFGQTVYEQDSGSALHRRSIYTFWRRIVGPTTLFDNANRQVCTVRSVRTNTPLHALTTLNDITYVEAARFMAERMMSAGTDNESRIRHGFLLATSREPDSEEIQILLRRLEVLQGGYAADPEAALALLAVGDKPRRTDLEPGEHASYTALASMLLNLDETITRQ